MKYFLVEMDQKSRCPYNINKNRAIDIRLLTQQRIDQIPAWNILAMDLPNEWIFPDILCSPFLMVSENFINTIEMYQPNIPYKGIKLWNKESGLNATYFIPFFHELECLSDKCQYNSIGNRILKLVLDSDKIGEEKVFRIKDYGRNCVVGRMDFIESLLRRGVVGVELKEVEVCRI